MRDRWLDVWFFGLQLTLQLRPDEVRPVEQQGVRHLGVVLHDRAAFDTTVDRLRRLGVRWLQEPTAFGDGELSAKFGAKVVDPSGNVVELKHYADVAAFRSGTA